MGERLALAVRLARRDLRLSLAGSERFIPSVHMPVQTRPQASSQCGFEPSQPPVKGWEVSTESQARACTRAGGGEEGMDRVDKEREGRGGRDRGDKEREGGGGMDRGDKEREGRGGRDRGDKEREGGGRVRREERRGGDKRKEDNTELVCLKRALAQQVHRLQELCANEEEKVEQEEENERERRVAAEHVAAMARKLYDLQRQVIMSDGGGGDKGGGLQGKKLAAARRAATRTLHSFSSTHQSLPNQLLQLVGQLCGDKQSSELLALAQSYSDVLTAARMNSLTPQQRKAGIKQKGKRMANMLNPVSSPRGSGKLKTHFSEPTFSSITKQQRTVLSSGMKTSSYRSSTAKPKGRSGARRRQKAGRNRRERIGKETAEVKRGFGSWEDSEGHKATQVTEAVGPDFSSPPVIPPSSPLLSQCQSPGSNSNQSVDTQGSGTPQPSTGPFPHTSHTSHTSHSSVLPQGELPHLVTTLMRMEEEELMICKKWNQTLHDQPPPQIVQHTRTRGDTGDHPRSERCGQHGSGAHLEPWTPLEILADCLLEEAVCDVCSEMADTCDSLANSIFFLEFQLPPTTSCS